MGYALVCGTESGFAGSVLMRGMLLRARAVLKRGMVVPAGPDKMYDPDCGSKTTLWKNVQDSGTALRVGATARLVLSWRTRYCLYGTELPRMRGTRHTLQRYGALSACTQPGTPLPPASYRPTHMLCICWLSA
eukprot:24092-Rhodomonas_salina.2